MKYFFACGLVVFTALNFGIYLFTFSGRLIGSGFVIFLLANVCFWAIALVKVTKRDPGYSTVVFRRPLSWKMKLFAIALLAFCGINTAFNGGSGSPSRKADGYYKKSFNSRIVEIDRAEFDRLSNLQTRLFSGLWLAISLAFAVDFLLQKRN